MGKEKECWGREQKKAPRESIKQRSKNPSGAQNYYRRLFYKHWLLQEKGGKGEEGLVWEENDLGGWLALLEDGNAAEWLKPRVMQNEGSQYRGILENQAGSR